MTSSRRNFLQIQSLEDRSTPTIFSSAPIVFGAGAGWEPEVRMMDFDGTVRNSFQAYNTNFRGGVRVAVGDLNGDGRAEIVTAPGAGGTSQIKVFDGVTQLETLNFYAYDSRFEGGVSIAVGMLNNQPVIVTGAGFGGGPHVKVFTPNGKLLNSFMAYAPDLSGGITVAVGDVFGDGKGAIITGAGPGGGPHVNVFSPEGVVKYSTFAYSSSFRNGVTVAAGDVGGTGKDVIITGPGPGGGPHINFIDPVAGHSVQSFFAYDENFRGGVDVAVITDQNGKDLVATAPGPGGGPNVRVFQVPLTSNQIQSQISNFWGFPQFFRGGVNFGFGFGFWQPYLTPMKGSFAPIGDYWPTAAPSLNWYGASEAKFWESVADPVYVDADPRIAPRGWNYDIFKQEWVYTPVPDIETPRNRAPVVWDPVPDLDIFLDFTTGWGWPGW